MFNDTGLKEISLKCWPPPKTITKYASNGTKLCLLIQPLESYPFTAVLALKHLAPVWTHILMLLFKLQLRREDFPPKFK